jgi:hypothetical protein
MALLTRSVFVLAIVVIAAAKVQAGKGKGTCHEDKHDTQHVSLND